MTSPLLINESPLQVLPSLAVKVGLNEAIILQQIHYWLNPKFNKNHFEGRIWVYNTYEQWQEQFPFWGEKTIRRAIASLETSGILMSFLPRSFEKKKYYTINYEVLNQLCGAQKSAETLEIFPSGQNDQIETSSHNPPSGQNDQIDLPTMTSSYIDTEITHEITHPPLTPPSAGTGLDDDEIFNKMISAWNTTVQKKLDLDPVAYVSEGRKSKLQHLLVSLFKNNFSAWQTYCQQISTNQFLLGGNGTGFRITLDWALNPENACKVLEGFYYDKASSKGGHEFASEVNLQALERDSVGRPYADFWIHLSREILRKLGQGTYNSWFKNLKITDLTDKVLTFGVESVFAKDYISTHYHKDLLAVARSVHPTLMRIEYNVSPVKGFSHV